MSSSLRAFSKIYNYEPRAAIQKLLELFDEKLNANSPSFVIFLSAPTGYGKSSCTIAMAEALVKGPNALGERLIHVLPLRAIVEDLYNNAKAKEKEGKIDSKLTVGAQAMHILDAEKAPYMLPRLVFTTLDSFVHNLFKRPVAEMHKYHSHFDVPRYAIYSSVIVFDEAHLFSAEVAVDERELEDKHKRMLTAFLASLRSLSEAKVPIIIMTATMPDSYLKMLAEYCFGGCEKYLVEVDPGLGQGETREEIVSNLKGIRRIVVGDKDFYGLARKTNPRFEGIISENDIISTLLEIRSSYEEANILVVRNTVKRAIETFERLNKEGFKPLLLHGRMTVGSREEVLRRIKSKPPGTFLIATQIIEAGVDIDFDVLISDATVLTSLIQRVGRVGRKEARDLPFKIFVVEGEGDGVYSKSQVKSTLNMLREIKSRDEEIGWRVSTRNMVYDGFISYKWMLEKLYGESIHYPIDKTLLRSLHDIDQYFVDVEVRELQNQLCSFVRSEGLIAVAVKPKVMEFSNAHEALKEAYRSMLTLSFNLLRKRWEEIVKIKDEEAMVLCLDKTFLTIKPSNDVYRVLKELSSEVPCRLLNALESAVRKLRDEARLIPLAIMLNEDLYDPEVGLKIG